MAPHSRAGGEPANAPAPAAGPTDGERADTATAALAQLIATTEAFHRRATDAEAAGGRVAHELHDTVAQSLVTAHRFLEAARASLAAGRTDAAASQLESAQAAVLQAIAEVRLVIDSVRPPGDAG